MREPALLLPIQAHRGLAASPSCLFSLEQQPVHAPPSTPLRGVPDGGPTAPAASPASANSAALPAIVPCEGHFHPGTSEVVPPVPTQPAATESRHPQWLHVTRAAGQLDEASNGQDRRTLFELLRMFASQECPDILDTAGLGGPVKQRDIIYLRGHTGHWIGTRGTEVVCNKADRSSAMPFVLETRAHVLRGECKVAFRLGDGHQWLATTPSHDVRVVERRDGSRAAEAQFVVQADHQGDSPIVSGTAVYLKSVGCGRLLNVEGDLVRVRSHERGTLQRIVIEKVPAEAEVPAACPAYDLSLEEKAWILRRGVQCALVNRQQLAKFLGGHRPSSKEVLRAYARLWEAEWRCAWGGPQADGEGALQGGAEGAEDSGGSPASRHSSRGAQSSDSGRGGRRSKSRPRTSRREWILGMVSGVSPEDRHNGDLFVSALRSFFASALRMSQLEADPVQRVIEAFAEALAKDKTLLDTFSGSMLPEQERKTYRTVEEVLFGLTYTTLMLNTDMHNKQVSQKMWDNKKFVGAGKDCGVTGGLMLCVFKHIQREEL